jgi:hypothetical protein
MRNMRNIFKSKEIKGTYKFKEVKTILDAKLLDLKSKYSFVEIGDDNSFKHFIDKESYHFKLVIKLNLDKKFLSEKYNSKGIDFPIEFDIDVEHATRQYVDHIISDIFAKFNALMDAIKLEYDNYKPQTKQIESCKKDSMIV